MDPSMVPWLATLAAGGLVAGLALLVRGFAGYRTAGRIGGLGTSTIATMAAGEVRVTGTIEPAEVLLESALQSAACVYYRSTIRARDADGESPFAILNEERAIGFRVRDATGDVRVFPRGASWDVPNRFAERSSALSGEPVGLRLRSGPAYRSAVADREAQIAALLTPSPAGVQLDGSGTIGAIGVLAGLRRPGGDRHYAEARLEPGDIVTVVGRALPFGQLADAPGADEAWGDGVAADDPEVAASIAAARAAGTLVDPTEAWGNAAIPGFGIGRPVREPELDPAATPAPLAAAEAAAAAERTFDIDPDALVLAASAEVPLLIAAGTPGSATERHQDRFIAGLLGAALAIASAVGLAFVVASGTGL